MSTEITIPSAGDLALVVERELHKLPSESLHNHFHQLSERAANVQEDVAALSLASLLLCAIELDHTKGKPDLRSGLPWKEWVKSNCDFSHVTATKYAKALKCARDGMIDGLDPDLIPETAPSDMSADELRDTCKTLSRALRGLGGRRQLYLQLEIIALPGGKKDNSEAKGGKTPTEDEDAEELFTGRLRPLGDLFAKKRHLKLRPDQARKMEALLLSYLDDLKLIK